MITVRAPANTRTNIDDLIVAPNILHSLNAQMPAVGHYDVRSTSLALPANLPLIVNVELAVSKRAPCILHCLRLGPGAQATAGVADAHHR